MLSKTKNKIKSIFNKNYKAYYNKKQRARLKNKDFSIFSPNCYAGIIYHRLGQEFLSPTINMLFPIKKQYLKFVSNIEEYLKYDLIFIKDEKYPMYPVGMLGDVKIVFNHYKTEEEALSCWNRRKTRVNYDNLYLIFDDIADAEYEDLIAFNKIKCKGKVILSAKAYPELENIVTIKKYAKTQEMRAYLMEPSEWTGLNPADKCFDYVSWLNN